MLTLLLLACLVAAPPDEVGSPTDPATLGSGDVAAPAPAPAAAASTPSPAASGQSVITSPAAPTGQHAGSDDPFEGAVEVFHFGFEENEDRNFDRHPDGWIRRKGPDFPGYIEGAIDREHGRGGKGASLCFKANGGRITMYS